MGGFITTVNVSLLLNKSDLKILGESDLVFCWQCRLFKTSCHLWQNVYKRKKKLSVKFFSADRNTQHCEPTL